MFLFQNAIKGILYITTASFLIFIFLSFIKPNKSGKWLRWYSILPQEEQKKYNPVILLNRTKKILLLISIVGTVGLVLSTFVNEKFKIPTTILIFVIFIIAVPFTGLKNALIDKGE